MPIGKGYKPQAKKKVGRGGKGGLSAKSASLPKGKVSGHASKKKFNAGAFARVHKAVFGLAKKEQMGKI